MTAEIEAQNQRIAATVAQQQSRVRAFVRRHVADAADAEEIVQEVFYELVVAYRLLKPVEHLAAWLLRIARNRIVDRFRSRSRRGVQARLVSTPDDREDQPELDLLETLELPDGAGPEADYARAVLKDALEAAVMELPPAQREIFIAHELEGRSFKQLASETGTNVNTLLARKHEAVAQLRRRLQAVYEELQL